MASKERTVTIYDNVDNHKLLHDLYIILDSQISVLKGLAEKGVVLGSQEMKSLDTCMDGLKKVISVGKELKGDGVSSMTNDEVRGLARKSLRQKKEVATT